MQVAGHGPSAVQQVPELERHRLARELHGGVVQEVLAAGLAIDLCLADALAGSPMHASLEHAKRPANRQPRAVTTEPVLADRQRNTKDINPERTVVMDPTTQIPAPRLIDTEGLDELYQALVAAGYHVIGPAVEDGAITLRELSSAAELPFGWGVRLEPGGYRVRRRDDTAAFGHSAGPQSWKRFLHPPRERLWSATRTADGFELSGDGAGEDEVPRYAFLGVRPCDLRAITIQDRVLAQPGSRYAARRDRLFVIAVNCTEPGETCFCTSMDTGPGVRDPGYDLALTELVDDRGHRFLVEVGSQHGADILWQVRSRRADDPTVEQGAVSRGSGGGPDGPPDAGRRPAGPDGGQPSGRALGRRGRALPELR